MSITRHRSRIRPSKTNPRTRMTHITTEPRSAMPAPRGCMTRRITTTSSQAITGCRSITLARTTNIRS